MSNICIVSGNINSSDCDKVSRIRRVVRGMISPYEDTLCYYKDKCIQGFTCRTPEELSSDIAEKLKSTVSFAGWVDWAFMPEDITDLLMRINEEEPIVGVGVTARVYYEELMQDIMGFYTFDGSCIKDRFLPSEIIGKYRLIRDEAEDAGEDPDVVYEDYMLNLHNYLDDKSKHCHEQLVCDLRDLIGKGSSSETKI